MSTLQVANVHFNTGGTSRFDVPLANVVRLMVNSANVAYATATTLQVNAPLTVNGDISISGNVYQGGSLLLPATSNTQTFTANGTWTKPSGYSGGSLVRIRLWGGGGSGSGEHQGGGGGGGAFHEIWKALSELGATETVTVGDGGAAKISAGAGNDGGDSSLGSHATAYGGKGGTPSGGKGGGGGGIASKGNTTGNGGGPGGGVVGTGITPNSTYGGGAGGEPTSNTSGDSYWGGGGGGGGNGVAGVGVGGDSYWGGGGGAGGTYPLHTGGTSVYGGAGGNSQSASGVEDHTAGTAPGGGGAGYWNAAGKGKAGARGEVHVTVFP